MNLEDVVVVALWAKPLCIIKMTPQYEVGLGPFKSWKIKAKIFLI